MIRLYIILEFYVHIFVGLVRFHCVLTTLYDCFPTTVFIVFLPLFSLCVDHR